MQVVVTGGPAITPIDRVRRITNFSTGELAAVLADRFCAAGHAVTLIWSTGATARGPRGGDVRVVRFATNQDLAAALIGLTPNLILHTAALSDYEVADVRDAAGEVMGHGKIPSRCGELHVRLTPAPKILGTLRERFPQAKIVGWKYEVDGVRADAVAAGRRQIKSAEVDACVLNGPAFGEGFGLLERTGEAREFAGKAELADGLVRWAGETGLS